MRAHTQKDQRIKRLDKLGLKTRPVQSIEPVEDLGALAAEKKPHRRMKQ
jgi:hypothetical protein